MNRAAPHENAGQLGGGFEVGERCGCHGMAAPAPSAPRFDLGDELDLTVGKHRSLGRSRRSRRENGDHRTIWIFRQGREVPASYGEIGERIVVDINDEGRLGPVENGGSFGRDELVVHPCGDNADLGGGDE